MRRHLTATSALVLAATLVVAGCSSRPEKASTVDGPVATSTASPTAAAGGEEPEETEPPVVAAAALTQEQIDAALLAQEDMPEGWALDPTVGESGALGGEEAAEEDTAVYEPAECKEFFAGLDTTEGEPIAEGEVGFSTEEFMMFAQTIQTWETLDSSERDEAIAEMSRCADVTMTSEDGTVTTSTISALDMPNYGDWTFATRIASSSDIEDLGELSITLDLVSVAIGNTSVSFVAGGFAPLEPAELRALVEAGMRKVEAAV